ncbi:restriction endonuclease subunit S [Jeotgalibaca ciconiae]|uniref:restriction endonuclease subunit S n=1 Tax=Jeotgalibaca ciconiae TaxID=2496265 RepID=UPI001D132535|nr:restriction endonuclease subunit S [Jeotgalibaca ciconiae]
MDKKAPVVRFKGFEDEWEQRKLGDMVDRLKSYSLSRDVETSEETGIKYIHYGDIHTKVADKITRKSNLPTIKNGIYESLQKGDLILADASEDYQGIATPSIIIEDMAFQIVAGLHTIAIRPIEVDSIYLYYLINTQTFRRHGYRVGTGMKVFGISVKNIMNFTTLFPSYEEQVKTGSLLLRIEKTIALHQRKLETLKQLKKGFLQKLFPKNQENVPEIRFANFQAEWEQRKLDEISDKVTEKNINNEFTETLTNSAEYGIINQREFFDKDISNKKNLNGYYVVRKDDFVYNPRISNYAPVGPIKRNKLGRTGVMSPLYYIFRTHNIDKTFLEYYFDTTIWHRFMKLQGDSGARADRFAIKDSVFKTMPIPSPSIEEQEKIGCIFKVIDDTVALHQKKLEQLQLLKSGLLQKMFI